MFYICSNTGAAIHIEIATRRCDLSSCQTNKGRRGQKRDVCPDLRLQIVGGALTVTARDANVTSFSAEISRCDGV